MCATNYHLIGVKLKDISTLFMFSSLLIMGCSQDKQISSSCDKDQDGGYVIKWEVYPQKSGDNVKVYMSDTDTIFSEPPVEVSNVEDYFVQIKNKDNLSRKFFRLKVDNSYSGVISNRNFNLKSVQNFRDLGGYYNKKKQQIKWSKIYRSGDFANLNTDDYQTLQNLKIKTIIDFRNSNDREENPDLYRGENMIYLPIEVSNKVYIRDKIIDGSFLRNDAILYTQDMYRSIIENDADSYAKLFEILCDENNYPVVFHGHLGKDKVGIACYFILKALDIPSETIAEDYLLSNYQIFKDQVIGEAQFLPERMQEAATVMCKVDMDYINYAEFCMMQMNGTVETYMTEKLKLTPEKKEKLKQILLYNNIKQK